MGLSALTRASVVAAMHEFDQLGRSAFLSKYGFKPSRRYFVLHDGRSYDSKAICGAAHGHVDARAAPLGPSDFSGGDTTVATKLRKLGFVVASESLHNPTGAVVRDSPVSGANGTSSRVFIVTWNPKKWQMDDDELADVIDATSRGEVYSGSWSTGGRRSGIMPGDHVFLFRQEVDRGLIAHGVASSEIYEDSHWDDSGRVANYVEVNWCEWVHHDERMTVPEMKRVAVHTNWDSMQGSGVQLHPDDAAALLAAWDVPDGTSIPSHSGDEAVGGLHEGAMTTVKVNRYERNRRARRLCIDHYGPICSVCDIDFRTAYGGLAAGFIHVHHIVPISSIATTYQLDPIRDLVPVCPNCHAMLHHGVDTPRDPATVRAALGKLPARR